MEKKLATRIYEFRMKRGISQDKLAEAIGFSRNYVSMVEGGREPGKNFVDEYLKFEADCLESEHSGHAHGGGSARGKLATALRNHGLTPAALAKKIGYDAGVINNVVTGSGRANEKMIETIIRELPELSKEDLMSGSESATVLSSDNVSGSYGSKQRIALPPGMKGRQIPLLSVAQAGGWDAGHSDEGWTGEAIFAFNVDDRQAFAIRVSGNSMEPEIREGDVVVCSPRAQLTNGTCAVVRTRSENAFIKFWRRKGDVVFLESANPEYKPIQFPITEIAGAWAVVQRIASGMIKKQEDKKPEEKTK